MTKKSDQILVLNAGSSSIKFAVFDSQLVEKISGIAEDIGGASCLRIGAKKKEQPILDHKSALSMILKSLETEGRVGFIRGD